MALYSYEKFMETIFLVEKDSEREDWYSLATFLGVPETVKSEADVCSYVKEHQADEPVFEGSYFEIEKQISSSKMELAFQINVGDKVFYQPIDYSKDMRDSDHIYYGKLATIIAMDDERYIVAFEDFPYCHNREERNRFYVNKEELLSVKCLAYAYTFMDWYLLDLGDSARDRVDDLCYSAGMDVDVYNDEVSLENVSLEAYRTLLLKDSDELSYYAGYLYEYSDYILTNLVLWERVTDIKEHSVFKMLVVLYQYYMLKGTSENAEYVSELFTRVCEVDMEVCSFAHEIGHTWFRSFDTEYFYSSNDVWTVGSITTEDDSFAELNCLYTCHADLRGKSNGYTCAFYRNDDGKVVVRMYEHVKSYDPYKLQFTQLDIADIEMDLSSVEDMAKLLADKVNTFAANFKKKDFFQDIASHFQSASTEERLKIIRSLGDVLSDGIDVTPSDNPELYDILCHTNALVDDITEYLSTDTKTEEVYDICFDYSSPEGYEERNLHERFTGTYLELQDYLKNLREGDCCYNISATRIED